MVKRRFDRVDLDETLFNRLQEENVVFHLFAAGGHGIRYRVAGDWGQFCVVIPRVQLRDLSNFLRFSIYFPEILVLYFSLNVCG